MPMLREEKIATSDDMSRILAFHAMNCELIPLILEKFEKIKPDCVLFDSFYLAGHVAGKIMNIPTVGWVSYPGPGSLDMEDEMVERAKNEAVIAFKKKLSKPILDKYNFD